MLHAVALLAGLAVARIPYLFAVAATTDVWVPRIVALATLAAWGVWVCKFTLGAIRKGRITSRGRNYLHVFAVLTGFGWLGSTWELVWVLGIVLFFVIFVLDLLGVWRAIERRRGDR